MRNDKRAVSPVVGVLLMVAITVVLAAIVGTFAYGYKDTMVQKPTPAFSVSRKHNTVSVVLHDRGGAKTIERLLVQSLDVGNTASLNDTSPTGEIEIGTTLESTGIKAGDHYVVNATVDGTNRVVIDKWM